jgi:hypothetical protein
MHGERRCAGGCCCLHRQSYDNRGHTRLQCTCGSCNQEAAHNSCGIACVCCVQCPAWRVLFVQPTSPCNTLAGLLSAYPTPHQVSLNLLTPEVSLCSRCVADHLTHPLLHGRIPHPPAHTTDRPLHLARGTIPPAMPWLQRHAPCVLRRWQHMQQQRS